MAVDVTGSGDETAIQAIKQDAPTLKADTSTAKDSDATAKDTAVSSQGQVSSKAPTKTSKTKTSTGLPESDTVAGKATKTKILQQIQTGATSLDFILDEPIIDRRKYETVVINRGTNGFALQVRYKALGKSGKPNSVEVLKFMVKKGYTQKECESIVAKMGRFCERWPFPIGGRDMKFKSNLFALFSFDLFPAKGYELRAIMLEKPRYKFSVNLVDPSTGEIVDEKITLAHEEFDHLVKPIPSLPQYVAHSSDAKLGPVDTDSKRNAVKFMKWVAWSFDGKLFTSEGFQQAYADLQHEYTGKYGVRVGNVQNPGAAAKLRSDEFLMRKAGQTTYTVPEKLCHIRRDLRDNNMDLIPAPKFLSAVGLPLPTVFVQSLSRGRLAFVTDAIDKCRDGDPSDMKKAWRAAAVAADTMNEGVLRGDPPPSQCSCNDEQMSSTTKHRCLGCLQSVLCSTMLPKENGEPVCTNCARKDARRSQPKKAMMARYRLKESLRLLISKEMYHWSSSAGKDNEAVKETGKVMLSATLDEVCKGVINGVEASSTLLAQSNANSIQIPDAYIDTNRPLISASRIGGRMDPFQARVDAVFSYGTFEGERRLHSPDNIVTTSLWANLTKAASLPAALAVIAKFINQDPSEREIDDLLSFMDDVYKCNKVTGYHKSTRLTQPLVPVEHAKHLKMWRTAIPPKLSGPIRANLYKYAKFSLTDENTDAYIDKARILKIVGQIEEKFNKVLPRAKDQCPWPSLKETMPKDWCWGNCWSLFSERQQREWAHCNRYWEQIDIAETLFLECVWQYCDPAYIEFLGLPLVAYWFHVLRFAIGKKDHRRGMRTGWKSIKPISIDDRDDALNNVLFETCTSNFLKNNFLDSDLVVIREELAKLVIPKEFFDPELRTQMLAGIAAGDERLEIDDISEMTAENEDEEDEVGGRSIDMDRILSYEDESGDDDDNGVTYEDMDEGKCNTLPPLLC